MPRYALRVEKLAGKPDDRETLLSPFSDFQGLAHGATPFASSARMRSVICL
ncbi:hypothetical protein D3C78_1947580 [compost metagenome]